MTGAIHSAKKKLISFMKSSRKNKNRLTIGFLSNLNKILSEDPHLSTAIIARIASGIRVVVGSDRVLITDAEALSDRKEPLEKLVRTEDGLLILGTFPRESLPVSIPANNVRWLDDPNDRNALRFEISALFEHLQRERDQFAATQLVERYRYVLDEMIAIARAITQERDVDKLLGLILEKSRYITGADAGSIYVLEQGQREEKKHSLRFKLSQNDSVDFHSKEFVMPVSNRSIVGSVVLMRKPINIPDVYDLDPSVSYEFDRSYDRRSGYRSRSMLTMPLVSAQDEVIGVIQLINKKRNPSQKLLTVEDVSAGVVAFDKRSEELLATLAAQAGIALENALLYDEIRKIFEGFVRASVQAIEQRDPSTSGHSLRVSSLACALAKEVDRTSTGVYKNTSIDARDLQELNYACLLHDFGKIGVREQVLLKAKKLYPHQASSIRLRVDLAIKTAEIEFLRAKNALLEASGKTREKKALERDFSQRKRELEAIWEFIQRADEPTLLKESTLSLSEVQAVTYTDGQGKQYALLDADEIAALSITRGSLNRSEIDEIRSHVVHTYNFLSKIPWGKSMARIPEIARAHHERLDGSGYPNGMTSDQIPLLSKIMAIADIYDALTAADRTYKKAMPVEKALRIIESEAAAGFLDLDLVNIFIENKVYSVVDENEK
jgi:HD-GYP domain-containing protein (c-di-GMP phosphodiesterase class II)